MGRGGWNEIDRHECCVVGCYVKRRRKRLRDGSKVRSRYCASHYYRRYTKGETFEERSRAAPPPPDSANVRGVATSEQ